MRRGLFWMAGMAAVVMILMMGMFWLFYSIPVAIFVLAMMYYIIKSSYQRLRKFLDK